MSYAPNLIVEERIKIRKTRELPLFGHSLVKVGENVKSETSVLSAELAGDLLIIRVADRLGIEPAELKRFLKVDEKNSVTKGQLLAESKSLFGLFKDEVRSPGTGTIEYYLESTGHLGLRLPSKTINVLAYITGTVVECVSGRSVTIETEGSLIQGIFGVGGERNGVVLYLPNSKQSTIQKGDLLGFNLTRKIICGGASFSVEAIEYAEQSGAVGIFTGSITSENLEKYTKTSLGISMTGDEELSLSLIITEGFGDLPLSDKVDGILQKLDGKEASLSGATQVRAGAIRPELIVSESKIAQTSEVRAPIFEIGRKVRCLRAPHFGSIGEIKELPSAPQQVSSGAVVRVALVGFALSKEALVPRANLEIVD